MSLWAIVPIFYIVFRANCEMRPCVLMYMLTYTLSTGIIISSVGVIHCNSSFCWRIDYGIKKLWKGCE